MGTSIKLIRDMDVLTCWKICNVMRFYSAKNQCMFACVRYHLLIFPNIFGVSLRPIYIDKSDAHVIKLNTHNTPYTFWADGDVDPCGGAPKMGSRGGL